MDIVIEMDDVLAHSYLGYYATASTWNQAKYQRSGFMIKHENQSYWRLPNLNMCMLYVYLICW